jgi:DNA-binding ferritin-like protein
MEILPRFFFSLQTNIRMYHWQTDSYSRHKATDNLLENLDPLIDKFMEVYQGKYGKIKKGLTNITVRSLNEETAPDFINQCIQFLNNICDEEQHIKKTDSDILTIRDEITGILNQTLYLFTFN